MLLLLLDTIAPRYARWFVCSAHHPYTQPPHHQSAVAYFTHSFSFVRWDGFALSIDILKTTKARTVRQILGREILGTWMSIPGRRSCLNPYAAPQTGFSSILGRSCLERTGESLLGFLPDPPRSLSPACLLPSHCFLVAMFVVADIWSISQLLVDRYTQRSTATVD